MNSYLLYLTTLFFSLVLLSSCGDQIPKCSDKETLDTVKSIILNEFNGSDSEEFKKEDFDRYVSFKFPRASAFDEGIKKYSCDAEVHVKDIKILTVTYESQIDDISGHIVAVGGIEAKDGISLFYAIKNAIEVTKETVEPIETTSPEQNGYTEADAADEIASNENTIQLEDNEKQVDATNEKTKLSPSFDCSKATTNAETMICNSSELAEADVVLSLAYASKYENSVEKDILQAEQNAWRKIQRDSCWDEACILQAYKQRIHELTL